MFASLFQALGRAKGLKPQKKKTTTTDTHTHRHNQAKAYYFNKRITSNIVQDSIQFQFNSVLLFTLYNIFTLYIVG